MKLRAKRPLQGVEGLLFDLNGVLYVGRQALPGAPETLRYLQEKRVPCRYLTNTTTHSRRALHNTLTALGFRLAPEEIVSAPQAALLYLRKLGKPVCHLLLAEEVKQDFAEFPQSSRHPDYVVVGDIGAAWNYDLLNTVFRALMRGAQLIALHRNKFWQTETGLQMDIGAFVAGLEYVTGKPALVIGKPSPAFFAMALQDLGVPAAKTAIVGDDIDADIGGGQACGLTGILVKTGKYRADYAASAPFEPDLVLDSVRDLAAYF